MTTLYERLKEVNDVAKFFQFLASKNVLLISKEEASDRYGNSYLLRKFGNMIYFPVFTINFRHLCAHSDVTEEMARSFLVKTEASSQ